MTRFEQFIILQALVHKPTTYLHELQDKLFQTTGVRVHPSIICRTIKNHGFTHKKVCRIALQQSEQLRLQFMAEISMYDRLTRQVQQEETVSVSMEMHLGACQHVFFNYK